MTEQAQRYLATYNIKPSVQRVAVMVYLMTNHTHPTADEIFSALYPSMPTLSKTTIYNTLNILADRGAILALGIDDKTTRFDGDTSLHAHFMCKCCGSISDIHITNNDFVLANTPQGTKISDVQLLYKGVCEKCNKYDKTNS